MAVTFQLSLVLFTRVPSPPKYHFSTHLFLLHFLSSHFFSSSSATALCTSILTIGKLLVHTLCILRTFCSHHIHLATHLSHHQITLCKITTAFSSCWESYSHTSQCPLPQLLLHYLLYSTRVYLSIAVSGLSQGLLHILLMDSECCRLPRNSHTKSKPFFLTMLKNNMSRKSPARTYLFPASTQITLCHQRPSLLCPCLPTYTVYL